MTFIFPVNESSRSFSLVFFTIFLLLNSVFFSFLFRERSFLFMVKSIIFTFFDSIIILFGILIGFIYFTGMNLIRRRI